MIDDRVRSLREAFDRSFAEPRRDGRKDLEDFIAIRAGGDPYALRLRDIATIAARRRIVPVPSPRREFLGMAGHRGALAAVFSLPALLGYGGSRSFPRWFVLLKSAPGLALAFDGYEGFVRVGASDVFPAGDAATQRRFVSQALEDLGVVRYAVDIPAAVAALARRDGTA